MFSRNLLIAFAAYIFVLPANMYAQLNSPSVPCSKISWWTSDIPSKQPAASVNCSSTNPYLGTIYEDHTGVGIHVNYADGKSMSEPTWVYFLETEFINANGTINITVPNFPWWNNTYYLFNDADYFDPNQPPQFYLDHVTIATYGVGTYRFKIWDSKSPQLWGTIDIVVIPKIKRIWVEATPICENNYLPVSSSNAPSYSFKVKTEPPLTDIFSTGITDACFSVQPGIYDNVGNIVTSIPVQGISACHFNGGAWNYLTQQYPSIVDYSISGVDLWSFFHSTYPAPLMVKVIFDDDAIAQPAEMIYPLIINTSSAHIQNVIDPSDKAPAFHLNEYTVNGNQTWSPADNPLIWTNPDLTIAPPPAGVTFDIIRIQRRLTITAGSFLTIKNMNLEFGPDAKVVVEAQPGFNNYGARLKLDNSMLSAYSGGGCASFTNFLWDGITVQGNSSKPQTPLIANSNGAITYQGLLEMENGTTIAYARNGVKLWDGSLQTGGGLVKATQSNFVNNKRAVEFEKYSSPTGASNMSFFERCNFITNNILPSPFFCFISAWGVRYIRINGCAFLDNAQDPNGTNYGLLGEDAGFAVDQFGATGNFPSLFRGLQTACRVNDLSGLGAMRLRNSRFENNQIAIHSRGVKAPEISNNTIELTGGNGYIGEGVFLETGTAYAVKGNHISGNENYPTWGVMAWNTGTDPNEVKQNYFYNLTVANIANYVNTNGSVLNPKGLQYLCNYHENNRYDIAALGINTATHGICAEQGSSTVPAGNQFSAAFTNHVDIYNHPSGVGDIDYYYQSGQAPNTTVGNVNSIYSSNTNNCEDRGGTDLPSSVYSSLQHFLYATDEELTYPENRRDSLYYWVRQWNSPYARVMEADMLMEDGNIAAAIATYHNIAGSFEMAEEEASEFAYGKTLLEIRAVLAGEAKTMKELDNTTVDQLTAIAENAKAWAKVRAQNWLTLYDGRQFTNTILWPLPEPMMRKISSTQSLATKIFPNPAHEYLTINYQNSTKKGALLQITDIIGRTVLSQPLEGLQGQINLEIKDLNPGVYLYKITDSGKMTLNGKFTKQ